MNTKHTPGPWHTDGKLESQTCITAKKHESGADPIIARIFDSSHVLLSEQEANARLITAAPFMYERLVKEIGQEETDKLLGH